MDRRSFLFLPLAIKQALAGRLKITDVRVSAAQHKEHWERLNPPGIPAVG